jgi:hypothetical protein
MNWVPQDPPIANPQFHVVYTRPGGEFCRLGPMLESYARGMAQEYHRKGLKDVRVEEWGPVKSWRLE